MLSWFRQRSVRQCNVFCNHINPTQAAPTKRQGAKGTGGGGKHPMRPSAAIQQCGFLLFEGDLIPAFLKTLQTAQQRAALALVNTSCAKAVSTHRDERAAAIAVIEHLVGSLGAQSDEALLEIITALHQEAQRRSQGGCCAVGTTATAATANMALGRAPDAALLKVVAVVQREASHRGARYSYGRLRLASAASGERTPTARNRQLRAWRTRCKGNDLGQQV